MENSLYIQPGYLSVFFFLNILLSVFKANTNIIGILKVFSL